MIIPKTIKIIKCRLCHSKKLRKIYSFGNLFISNFVLKKLVQKSKRAPLNLIHCKKCDLYQLEHTAPQELLYKGFYWYKSGVTDTMRKALKEIYVAGKKYAKLKKGDVVLDIGANDGTLLKYFKDNDYKTIGCEPAKNLKEELNEKAKKFNNILKKFYDNLDENERTKIIGNIKKTLKQKYNYNDDTIDNIISTMKMSGGADILDQIEDKILNGRLNKGKQPIRDFLTKIKNVAPNMDTKPIESVEDLIITSDEEPKSETETTQIDSKAEMIKKIRPIYTKYKDNINPTNLEIKIIDRIIFIATTFIIRFITLMIIEWGLSTNLINNFYRAFLYYCLIYLLFFVFIIMIVNVIVHYPLIELYSSMKIIDIPNLFYYFYIYTNGYIRLLIHIFIILLLLFIPYIINIDKINFIKSEEKKINISYDYEKKKKILDSISIFSFIIWILTSIIASKN